MRHDDNPEDDLEGDFRRLVAKLALGQKSAGPATKDLYDVESRFWNAPFTGFRAPLIASVGKESEDGEYKGHAQQDSPVDRTRKPTYSVSWSRKQQDQEKN